VPQEVREERNSRLLAQVNAVAENRYKRHINSKMQILVEGPSKKNPARYSGRPAAIKSSSSTVPNDIVAN